MKKKKTYLQQLLEESASILNEIDGIDVPEEEFVDEEMPIEDELGEEEMPEELPEEGLEEEGEGFTEDFVAGQMAQWAEQYGVSEEEIQATILHSIANAEVAEEEIVDEELPEEGFGDEELPEEEFGGEGIPEEEEEFSMVERKRRLKKLVEAKLNPKTKPETKPAKKIAKK